jgi:hypothetical protein
MKFSWPGNKNTTPKTLPSIPAGDYNHAIHIDHPGAPSLLEQYLDSQPRIPKVGGPPRQTAPGNKEGKIE